MIVLPVLLQNIIEIANVAVEILLIFLYLSLLSKRKIDKLPLVFFVPYSYSFSFCGRSIK